MIDTILDVICAKVPYTTIQRAMHIHPVWQPIATMLGELNPLWGSDGLAMVRVIAG